MIVLVVDDSKSTRLMISHGLRELGVSHILEADSAEQAESMLRIATDVDLIVTDWHMPGMTGLQLLIKLRAQPRFKSTPIFLATSETAGENVVAALRAGATNYIIKPFDRKQLAEKLGPYITTARASGAARCVEVFSVTQAGTLSEGELANLIQYFVQTRKSGRCELECETCTARIYLRAGRITGAQYQLQTCEEAFFTCFCVRIKRYRFHEEDSAAPAELAISSSMSSTALLLEAAARRDKHASAQSALPGHAAQVQA